MGNDFRKKQLSAGLETFKNLAYRSGLVPLDQELTSYNQAMNVMALSIEGDACGDIVFGSAMAAGNSVMSEHLFTTVNGCERGDLWRADLAGMPGLGILDHYIMEGVS